MSDLQSHIDQLIVMIAKARRILLFTGAGISTGSGIPDFRGPNGIWKRRQPVYYEDFLRSENARIELWEFKLEGWDSFRDAVPNAVHYAGVALEKAGKLRAVVTQNIDGLHSRAGTSPDRLVELHGTNLQIECQSCRQRTAPGPHYEFFRTTRLPPRCPCGGWLKPATISFGQSLDPRVLEIAEMAATEADLAVALGSSLSVHPAATIPLLAAQNGAPYAIINSGPTEHDDLPQVTLRIEGDVGVVFPQAVSQALLKSA